jgi:hypothetical protein
MTHTIAHGGTIVRQDRKKAAEFCILSATAAEFFINALSFVAGPFAAAAQQVLYDDRVCRPLIRVRYMMAE